MFRLCNHKYNMFKLFNHKFNMFNNQLNMYNNPLILYKVHLKDQLTTQLNMLDLQENHMFSLKFLSQFLRGGLQFKNLLQELQFKEKGTSQLLNKNQYTQHLLRQNTKLQNLNITNHNNLIQDIQFQKNNHHKKTITNGLQKNINKSQGKEYIHKPKNHTKTILKNLNTY